VLEQLVIRRVPLALSLNDLCAIAERPWAEQPERVFSQSREQTPPSAQTAFRRPISERAISGRVQG
jgi:hypothetical protein